MPVFTHFTHDEMVAGIEAIAEALSSDHWAPSLLVGVGRGGLAPAVYLSHRLGLPVVSVDHSAKIAPFGEGLIAELANHKGKLLFVEDINDSGKTIGELRAALARNGADLSRIRFAVLMDNVRSAERIDYAFRKIDRATQKDWFVFPWEAMAPQTALEADAAEVPERIA